MKSGVVTKKRLRKTRLEHAEKLRRDLDYQYDRGVQDGRKQAEVKAAQESKMKMLDLMPRKQMESICRYETTDWKCARVATHRYTLCEEHFTELFGHEITRSANGFMCKHCFEKDCAKLLLSTKCAKRQLKAYALKLRARSNTCLSPHNT